MSAATEIAICFCGAQWFVLRRDDGSEGRLAVNADGSIAGYHGTLYCAMCGAERVEVQP